MSQDLLQVFLLIIFPQTPENNIRIISNFFENSPRYSQVKVHNQYQTTPVVNFPTGTSGVVYTTGKFATSANNTGGK